MADQLSFADVFAASAFEQKTAHLPSAIEQAIPYFRDIIERHHAAMLDNDFTLVQALNDEAHDMAVKLNNGEPGILADDNSPGNVLENATRAVPGDVPLWGQTGEFKVEVRGVKMRIDLEGIFGLAAMPVPGFSVYAVELDKPFISETGFRSFLGYHAKPGKGMLPDAFVRAIVENYMARPKGKLYRIEERYRGVSAPEAVAE